MKELHIVSCFPDDNYFIFEVETYLTNLRKHNLSNKFRGLVLIPHDRVSKGVNPLWKQMEEKFPESKFFYYSDVDGKLAKDIQSINYIPLLRPWLLAKHFSEFPELESDTILYTDSDIVFTENLDIQKYFQDDICYVSNVSSYLDKDYIDNKISAVDESKLEIFKKFDILDTLGKLCGINRQIIEENNINTGGVQYVLKGITSQFWSDVYNSCLKVRPFLVSANQHFMKGDNPTEKENNGYQSWCTDLFVVLYTLWRYKKEVKNPPELDFAWATDPISKINTVGIFHNAGASGPTMELNGKIETVFFKSKLIYRNNLHSPHFEPEYLDSVTPDYCTHYYTQAIKEVNNPIFK